MRQTEVFTALFATLRIIWATLLTFARNCCLSLRKGSLPGDVWYIQNNAPLYQLQRSCQTCRRPDHSLLETAAERGFFVAIYTISYASSHVHCELFAPFILLHMAQQAGFQRDLAIPRGMFARHLSASSYLWEVKRFMSLALARGHTFISYRSCPFRLGIVSW